MTEPDNLEDAMTRADSQVPPPARDAHPHRLAAGDVKTAVLLHGVIREQSEADLAETGR